MFTRRRVKACVAAAALSLFTVPAFVCARQQAVPPRNLTVTVTDKKGGLITGLTREAFTVLDGGRPSEVVSFAAGDAPATVGLLLDASGSANVARRGLVKTALTRFVKGCNPSDEFFLIAFNNAPQLVQGLTGDPADVLAALERYMAVRPWGQTALFDSLYVGLNQAEHGRYVRRAVVLLTDGQDNVSRYTFRELRRQLLESGVTVYAVGILDPNIDSALGYGGRAVLEDLAAASGGRAFFPESERDLNAAFEDLAAELRNQYVIGFTPSAGAAKKDGWHEVRVRLGGLQTGGKKLKVVARTRAGFYDVPPPRRD